MADLKTENRTRRDALCLRPAAPVGSATLALAIACQRRSSSHAQTPAASQPGLDGSPAYVPTSTLVPGRRQPTAARPGGGGCIEGNPHAIADGERAVQLVQLLRLPFPRRRRHGTGLDGPALALWRHESTRSMRDLQGRPNGMPSWAADLPTRQIWKLAAYVKSLPEANAAEGPGQPSPTPPPPPRQSHESAGAMRLLAALAALLLVGASRRWQADAIAGLRRSEQSSVLESRRPRFREQDRRADRAGPRRHLTYTWWAQRRGYVRNTLTGRSLRSVAGCRERRRDGGDDAPVLPLDLRLRHARRPRPRTSRRSTIRGFEALIVGVQMVGNDAMNTPPTHALARRGIIHNVRGYMLYGDYRAANPSQRSSMPWQTARWTSPWCGARWPATSPRSKRRPADHAGATRLRRPALADDVRHRDGRAPRRTGVQGRGGRGARRQQRQDRRHSRRLRRASDPAAAIAAAIRSFVVRWWVRQGLNRWPPPCEGDANRFRQPSALRAAEQARIRHDRRAASPRRNK